MNGTQGDSAGLHTSSQGHALAGAEWLDVHFEASRPEYEAMLRSVGLQPGWRVLDAGCGSGSYLPPIAEAVGPTGHVTALDLAPENVAAVEARLAGWDLPCPVAGQVGNLANLPFPDAGFDAVWCANVTQYLTDDELAATLREFRRVVRPGGLVAVKETDATMWNFTQSDPGLLWRWLSATRAIDRQIHGMLRSPGLRRWLERAGLEAVRQHRTPIEWWAPLRPAERTFLGDIFVWAAGLADAAALPEADQQRWQALRDLADPDHPINSPHFHHYEAPVVAVGFVPPPPVVRG